MRSTYKLKKQQRSEGCRYVSQYFVSTIVNCSVCQIRFLRGFHQCQYSVAFSIYHAYLFSVNILSILLCQYTVKATVSIYGRYFCVNIRQKLQCQYTVDIFVSIYGKSHSVNIRSSGRNYPTDWYINICGYLNSVRFL